MIHGTHDDSAAIAANQMMKQMEIAIEWITRAKKELEGPAANSSRDEWLEIPIRFLDNALTSLRCEEILR